MEKHIFIPDITEDRGVFRQIISYCKDGYVVVIRGFGSFRLRLRSARTGRNPRTGEPVEIPAYNTIIFKASPVVRRALEK